MSLAKRKLTAWILLATNVGASLFFGYLFITKGMPKGRESILIAVPVVTGVVSILSALDVRRSYRKEPSDLAGFWQLAIVDFYAVLLFAALLMGLANSLWPLEFKRGIGIGISLVLAFAFVFCLLLAARKGYSGFAQKSVCALSYLLIGLGWLAVGMIGITCIALVLIGDANRIFEFLGYLFFFQNIGMLNGTIFNAMRIGLCFLPLGVVVNRWVALEKTST